MHLSNARYLSTVIPALAIAGLLLDNHALMAAEIDAVTCTLRVSPGPYVCEEAVPCEITIVNQTDKAVRVLDPAQLSQGIMSVRITDESGREIAYTGGHMDGPGLREVGLEPGEKLTRTIDLNAPYDGFDLARPGRYVLRGVAYVRTFAVGPANAEIPSTNAASFDVREPSGEFQKELEGRIRRSPGSTPARVRWRLFTDTRDNVTALYCRLGLGDRDNLVHMARFRPIGRVDAVRCVLDDHSTLHILIPLATERDLFDYFSISSGLTAGEPGCTQNHLGRYKSKLGGQASLRLAANGTVAIIEANAVLGFPSTEPATGKAFWVELPSPTTSRPATQPTTAPGVRPG
jgi:hypothetical protein